MACGLIGLGLLILPGIGLADDTAASPDHPSEAAVVLLKGCTLEYKRDSRLGANANTQNSVIGECSVALGDRVKAGQVLGRIVDVELRAQRDVLASQASSDIAVRLAEAKHKLSSLQLERTRRLSSRNSDFVTSEEYATRVLEAEIDRLNVEEAQHQRKLAELQRKPLEAQIQAREIRSPHDGVVVEILKVPGQGITPNDCILHVVDPSEIRVTGYLDVTDAWRVRPGQTVRIWAELMGTVPDVEKEVFTGQVEYVDLQVSPESRTCKVTAIVANRDGLLRSGLEARMEITVRSGDKGTPPKSP